MFNVQKGKAIIANSIKIILYTLRQGKSFAKILIYKFLILSKNVQRVKHN